MTWRMSPRQVRYDGNRALGSHLCERRVLVPAGCALDTARRRPARRHDYSATWTVDTAEELAQGASLVDIGIEPWGALTPAAYLAGTVSARATDAVWTITQPAAELMWSALDGAAFRSHVLLRAGDLGGLGDYERFAVDPFAPFSLAIEGEVYLQMLGDHTFELVADDVGFLEIAAPGTTTYQRVVTAYYPDPVTGTFTVAAPGWYPFRIGFAQGLGLVGLGLRHAAPGQALESIARRRLRARADGLRGLVRRVFDEQLRVWDNDNSGGDSNARVLAVYATLRLAGGHDVIAREAVWTSPVRDLGAPLVDVPRVAWTARAANPANVEVELRACPTDACDGVAWSAPIANDAPAAVTSGERYLQARVRLRSNGARESELDALSIDYRVAE